MADIREMVLQAGGIACSGCAYDMEVILREKEGIIEASVDYADETIRIKYDPMILDKKAVFAAVRRLVFKVKILEEG